MNSLEIKPTAEDEMVFEHDDGMLFFRLVGQHAVSAFQHRLTRGLSCITDHMDEDKAYDRIADQGTETGAQKCMC